jgi:hypothetical protein
MVANSDPGYAVVGPLSQNQRFQTCRNCRASPSYVVRPRFQPMQAPCSALRWALGRLWRALFVKPSWGVYQNIKKPTGISVTISGRTVDGVEDATIKVIDADSVLDFGYRNEYEVSDYPTQDGGFAAYNKVANLMRRQSG